MSKFRDDYQKIKAQYRKDFVPTKQEPKVDVKREIYTISPADTPHFDFIPGQFIPVNGATDEHS